MKMSRKVSASIVVFTAFGFAFAQNTLLTNLTCDTFESCQSNNSQHFFCPNKTFTCICQINDNSTSYFLWILPFGNCMPSPLYNNSIRLDRNCKKEVENCTSSTFNAIARNTMCEHDNFCTATIINVTTSLSFISIQCSLRNASDYISNSSLTLQLPGKPQPPEVSFLSTTNTSITVAVTSPDATVMEYDVSISNYSHCINKTTIDQKSVTFCGLLSNTKYLIQAFAKNCANISDEVTASQCTMANPPNNIKTFIENKFIKTTWMPLGQCTTQYKISVISDHGTEIGTQYSECCFATQSISHMDNSNYYITYVSAANGMAGQAKTQHQFTVNVTAYEKYATIMCIDSRYDAPRHKCFIQCNNYSVNGQSDDVGVNSSVLLNNLQPGQNYTCVATAANSTNANTSSISENFNFTCTSDPSNLNWISIPILVPILVIAMAVFLCSVVYCAKNRTNGAAYYTGEQPDVKFNAAGRQT